MASASAPQGPSESHEQFYLRWIETQEQQLSELKVALQSDMKEPQLANLISKVQGHYRAYYVAKESAARQNILQIMSPTWRSPFENAFLWLGGWRPTMFFQLAYAEAGHQVEAELEDLLEGIDTPTMAGLSSEQLAKINNLQAKTQETENELTQRMAVLQREIADDPLVSLAQMEAAGEISERAVEREEGNTVEAVVIDKLKSLEELLLTADTLCYEMLDEMFNVLTVFQTAQYLVALGNLHVCIRKIGQSLYRKTAL